MRTYVVHVRSYKAGRKATAGCAPTCFLYHHTPNTPSGASFFAARAHLQEQTPAAERMATSDEELHTKIDSLSAGALSSLIGSDVGTDLIAS